MPLTSEDLSFNERIIDRMVEETGISQTAAGYIIQAVGGVIRTSLKRNERVYLPMIGWLRVVQYQQKAGRRPIQALYADDPQRRFISGNGIAILKRARKVIRFEPHRTLLPAIIAGVPNERTTLAWLRSKLIEPPDDAPEEPPEE